MYKYPLLSLFSIFCLLLPYLTISCLIQQFSSPTESYSIITFANALKAMPPGYEPSLAEKNRIVHPPKSEQELEEEDDTPKPLKFVPDLRSPHDKMIANTVITENAPPYVAGREHYALLLTGPSCVFKKTPWAREFIALEGKYYPNLDVQYIGGDARIQFYTSKEARAASLIDSSLWSEDELIDLLLNGPRFPTEDPVAEVNLKDLDKTDIKYVLEYYGVHRGFPRDDFPPLQ